MRTNPSEFLPIQHGDREETNPPPAQKRTHTQLTTNRREGAREMNRMAHRYVESDIVGGGGGGQGEVRICGWMWPIEREREGEMERRRCALIYGPRCSAVHVTVAAPCECEQMVQRRVVLVVYSSDVEMYNCGWR